MTEIYAKCINCGTDVCTEEVGDCECPLNNNGSQLDTLDWVCSDKCWEDQCKDK